MLRKAFSKVTGIPEQKLRNEALRKAAIKGRLKRVRKLLAEGADVDFRDVNKLTPLYFAATHGHHDIARLLLEKGADPDPGKDGSLRGTALVWCAAQGDLAMVRLLAEAGADLDLRDYSERTALHEAVWHGRKDIAAYLLEKGAAVDTQDRMGHTPLQDAVLFDAPETAKRLVTAGADVTVTNKHGEDIRAFALRKGQDGVAAHIDAHLKAQREKAEREAAEAARRKAELDSAIAGAATLSQPVKAMKPARFKKPPSPQG